MAQIQTSINRAEQMFEYKFGKMTFIYKIEGVEKAGDVVTDDSYYGEKIVMFADMRYTEDWYCDIEAFEASVASGRYKQIK